MSKTPVNNDDAFQTVEAPSKDEPVEAQIPPAETTEADAPATIETEETKAEAVVNPHVTVLMPPMTPITSVKDNPIHAYRVSGYQLENAIQKYPLTNLTGKELDSTWGRAVIGSFLHAIPGKGFRNITTRGNSDWNQGVEHEGKWVRPKLVSHNIGEGSKVTGSVAVAKYRQQTKAGNTITIPFWHSGFWLTIKAPTEAELHILDRKIANAKMRLGRETNGFAFSAHDVYLNSDLLDFLIDHAQSANIKDFDPQALRVLIKQFDFPIAAWGLGCSIYINGYPLSQPCYTDPEVCRDVTQVHLDLRKLNFVDRNAFTAKQIRHMEASTKVYTVDEVLKYQEELPNHVGQTFEITTSDVVEESTIMKLVLFLPTIQDYIDAGSSWIGGIVTSIDRALSSNFSSAASKNNFVLTHANITTLRQYGHFIKSIVYADGSYVDERDDINNLLDDMSSNGHVVKQIIDTVEKYIDSNTHSIIGIPAYQCPSCGALQTDESIRHPNIIPLEVTQLFFTLVDRKLWSAGIAPTPA